MPAHAAVPRLTRAGDAPSPAAVERSRSPSMALAVGERVNTDRRSHMSGTPYTPVGGEQVGQLPYEDYEDSRGQGLVTFAGVMLMLVAVLNTLYGIAAIDKANFFVNDAKYVFGNLNTWGWFLVALGVLQFFAALAIWRGVGWGRWFGVACASVNAILQTLWIPAYPVLAMTILTLDIIVIYGLLAYGGRRRAANAAKARG
jgi:hypothetical protein